MVKKLKIQMNGRSDQFQTPPEAFEILNLKGVELVGTLTLVDKPARERIKTMEMNQEKMNKRTKGHTIDIRDNRKLGQNNAEEIKKLKKQLEDMKNSHTLKGRVS